MLYLYVFYDSFMKIKFEDIFDLTDIEKTFEQTIEYDLLKLMEKWKNKLFV